MKICRLLPALSLLCFLFLPTASSRASVTIELQLGTMYASTNTSPLFPTGGLIDLLAITNGTWGNAQSLIAEFSGLTSSFVPTNAVLLGQFGNNDGVASGVTDNTFSFTYSGGLTAGEEMLAVCYPGLTTNSLAPGVGAAGFFFRTTNVIDSSDIAWVTPADGHAYGLFALTTDQGGTLATNLFTAGAGAIGGDGFTTVPEPSALMLLLPGLAITLFVLRRGKRSVA